MKRRKQQKLKLTNKTVKSKRIERAGTSVASLVSQMYILLVSMAALISAALYVYTIVLPEQERSERYQNFVLSNYAELAEASVTAVSKRLEVIARSTNVIDSFMNPDKAETKKLEKELLKVLPKAIGLRLVEKGTVDVDMESIPPISNVTLELLRKSGRLLNPPPEVVRVGQPDQYIAMVENVVNASGDILGYVLAGIEVATINEGLNDIRSIPGYIEFRQEFSGTVHVLGSVGDKGLKQGKPHNVANLDNSLWKMAYWPSPEEDFSAGDERNFFIAGLLCIFLLISILAFLTYKKINSILNRDVSSFMRIILENPDGALEIPAKSFELRIFYDMAYTLQRAVNERMDSQDSSTERLAAIPRTSETSNVPVTAPQKVSVSDDVKQAAAEQVERLADEVETGMEPVAETIISPSIFREYDIRGIVGETLTTETVRWIGQAIGSIAFERGEQSIIVGRDGRNSGEELLQALKEGILASGRDVVDIGMVPTPLVYFATNYLQSSSGVVVTGSHNPPDYNGLKVVIAGDSLHGKEIREIYNRIKSRNLLSGEGTESSQDILADYINNITGDIALTQPLKVVIDAGNGVAGAVAPLLLQALGCEVIGLYCDVNGNFPHHHPDPSKPENLEALREAVIKEQADIGLAFDGDGDRLGVVDSSAKIIWPDKLMMLFAKDVLSRHPGADIIYDVKCSRYLKQIIKKNNGRPLMWKTGHSLIKAKMKETGALLAGEQSGHIFFKERWYGFDDGLYAAARLLELLSSEMTKSEEVFSALPESITTPELTLDMPDDIKFDFIEQLVNEGDFAGGKVTDIDGLRIDYSTGWGLVRASNTTPCLVIRFEAETDQDMINIQAVFRQQILRFDPDLILPF